MTFTLPPAFVCILFAVPTLHDNRGSIYHAITAIIPALTSPQSVSATPPLSRSLSRPLPDNFPPLQG